MRLQELNIDFRTPNMILHGDVAAREEKQRKTKEVAYGTRVCHALIGVED